MRMSNEWVTLVLHSSLITHHFFLPLFPHLHRNFQALAISYDDNGDS